MCTCMYMTPETALLPVDIKPADTRIASCTSYREATGYQWTSRMSPCRAETKWNPAFGNRPEAISAN
jgi:hypothetical protein